MKVTNTKQLAAHLRDARLGQQLSQSKIGSRVGIRQDTVSSFEQNPGATKLDTLFKILSALELELEIKPRNAPFEVAGEQQNTATQWDQEW